MPRRLTGWAVIATSGEAPVYRPLGLLAFGVTLMGGVPIGFWMLAWLYLGAAAVPVKWVLLHASLQSLGFFGTLIPGIAPHLLARFAGRPVSETAWMRWVFGLLAAGFLVRVAGTVLDAPGWVVSACLAQAIAFLLFATEVWRSLDASPLRFLRRHLGASTGWLAAACLAEAWLRWGALRSGLAVPDMGRMRAVHAMALLGGVMGWVLGVLLRAGPMFAPGWRVPDRMARAVLPVLTAGVAVTVVGEAGAAPPGTAVVFARLGEFMALFGAALLLLRGGALERAPRALPMLARSPQEARLFRLAVMSMVGAAAGSGLAVALALAGAPAELLGDAVRHLVTIGFLTSVVVAMVFRLIPVLEGRPLPWPALRGPAYWTLGAAVLFRSAEVLVPLAGRPLGVLVASSGALVWLALVCVSVNLVGAMARR